MPTNRTPIERPRQRQVLTAEAIRLFAALEQTPRSQRDSKAFKDGQHELMRLLGLTSEFWTINSVLDRSRGPAYPPGMRAYDDWHTCRAVREQLLEAVAAKEREKPDVIDAVRLKDEPVEPKGETADGL